MAADRAGRRSHGLRARHLHAALALVACGAVGLVTSSCEALVDGQLGQVACAAEGAVGPPACPAGLTCQAGLCGAATWGGACAGDGDCLTSEVCLDPRTVGGLGAPFCTRACCSSEDCAPDDAAVCWLPPAGGGAYCRAAVSVGRGPAGTLGALAPCSDGAACRSGLCSEGRCADTCCGDTACAPLGVCRLDGPPRVPALGFWCGTQPGTAAKWATCTADTDCVSGLCIAVDAKHKACGSPCCSSAECAGPGGAAAACVELAGTHAGVRGCMPETTLGTAAVAVSCTEDADCRSGLCLDLAGRLQCSDLCCSDASCGAPASIACRPGLVAGAWALRCEPR
jgi:hypothetical protein